MNPKLLESWSEGIFRSIVAVGRPGKPLFIYIDSEILGEIANLNPKDAQKAFAKSFLNHYKKGEGESPFENAIIEALNWPKTSGFKTAAKPRILPLLALCVIAVTDKSPSPGQSVYRTLNDLLGNAEEAGKPPGYEFMPEIWEFWNNWLKNAGSKYGKPTARVIDHYALQGYARSQGFIRRRERMYITDFFSDSGILQGTKLQKEYLISLFETWLRGQGKKVLVLYRKIFESGEVPTRLIFSEILQNELENWDGLTQTESGRDSLVGYLAKDAFSAEWETICPVQKKIIGAQIDLGNGPTVVDESWPLIYVSQIEKKSISDILKKGITYNLNKELSIKVGGRNYYLFSHGKHTYSGIVEERNPKLFFKYTLLVEANLLEEMLESLEAYEAEHSEPEFQSDLDYYEICDLVFTKRRVTTDSKIKFKFPIDPPPKITLSGGLQFGKDQYERNYPPILQLPFDNHYDLLIDGNKYNFSKDLDHIKLSELDLALGSHEVQFGETKIVFYLVESKQIKPSSSSKGISFVEIQGAVKLGNFKSTGQVDRFRAKGAYFPKSIIPVQDRFISFPYEHSYLFLLQDNEIILRQIYVETGARFTRSHWRKILNLAESRLDLDLLDGVFSGQGYLFFKEAASRKCTVLRVTGNKDPQISRPRYMSNSANKAIESILLSEWTFQDQESEGQESSIRAKLQRVRSKAPPTQMVTATEKFEKIKSFQENGIDFGPLDHLLEWISEQENSFVTFDDFEAAWETLETGLHHKNWQESVTLLEHLGHVEVDWSAKKICVHPAVANILQGEVDYAVLVGSRPFRMQEILIGNAPELLNDPAEFEVSIKYQLRYAPEDLRNEGKETTGPAVALIKSSDFFGEKTTKILNDMGIEVCFNSGKRYLLLCPTVSEIALIGFQYDVALSNRFEVFAGFYESGNVTREHWRRIDTDSDPGIYRYLREGSSKIRAVRFSMGGPLFEVEPRWVPYIYMAHFQLFQLKVTSKAHQLIGPLPTILEVSQEKLLFVPACIRFPEVISRGLVLQTGLPVEIHQKGDFYQNVGKSEIREISRILGFNLIQKEANHTILVDGLTRDLNLRYGIQL